jgi:hypothetical protein
MTWNKVNLLIICTFIVATSCGKKAEKSEIQSSTSLETLFVKGDPATVIAGSLNTSRSFLSLDQIEDLNGYDLTTVEQFTEKELVVEKDDTASVETGNEPTETDISQETKDKLFSFKKENGEYIYSSRKSNFEFSFIEREGKLELISLQLQGGTYNLKPIHYSLKNSNDAFSILTETTDSDEGKILLAFTFTKKIDAKEIGKASTLFKYLYGPGVKIPWDQTNVLEVSICGKQSTALESIYRKAIDQWNEALSGRLTIKTNVMILYPPFSDLNTHCIYTVKDYQTIPEAHFVNSATTFPKADFYKGKLIDADIMIWVKEIAKFGTTLENTESLQAATAHELGHLLGLHHQFDKNIRSIMSYDGTNYVTAYDKEAIAQLYPLL